jgi:hypothetical protein
VLLELFLAIHNPLQHVVGLFAVVHLAAGGDDGAQELVSLREPLIEFLDLGQPVADKRAQPGTHRLEGTAGFHELDGVVDGGVQVLLGAAELGANEDAAGHEGDDAEQFLVDVDRGPVVAWRQLLADRLVDFVGNRGVEAHQGWCQAGLDGVGDKGLAGGELGVLGVHGLGDGIVEADDVVCELSELAEVLWWDNNDGEFLVGLVAA